MIIKSQSNVPLNQIWEISTLFPDCLQTSLENEHLRRGHSVQWCSIDEKKRKNIQIIKPLNEMNHPFFRNSLSHSKTTTCPSTSLNCLRLSLFISRSVWGKRLSGIFSGWKILVTVKHSLLPADLPLMYDTLTRKRMSSKPIFIKN